VQLPRSAIPTSSLGFGGAYLVGGSDARRNERLVHEAFDLGYRHFDVAPSYGLGAAEDLLGTALNGRRHGVTIAGKVGIARPANGGLVTLARSIAAPLRRLAPSVTRFVGGRLYGASARTRRFDLAFVRPSVEDSLRRLRTDYLDLLLLHEASGDDLTDELLTWLDKQRTQGVFRAIGVGVGAGFDRLAPIRRAHRDLFDVWQYAWDGGLGAPSPAESAPFSITHRALAGLPALSARLNTSLEQRSKLSELAGFQIAGPAEAADALLAAALAGNAAGIVLVGTRRADRLRRHARIASDPDPVRAGARLGVAIREILTEAASAP
jgi:D-threo-aldose 1-dehydrogenase